MSYVSIVLYALMPQCLVCRLVGVLFELRLPRPLMRVVIRVYGLLAGARFDEAELSVGEYPTLGAFFCRSLKPGARPFSDDPLALGAPCDGVVIAAGAVEDRGLWQIKDWRYSLRALLADDEMARRFAGGGYATIYLSPGDYHRFHAPCDAYLARVDHVPGRLWPVHSPGLHHVEGLYARNERVVGYFHHEGEREPFCAIVAVGGVAVGKIELKATALCTHTREHTSVVLDIPAHTRCGDEWGHFAVGSTIVVLLAPGAGTLDAALGARLRAGQPIGALVDNRAHSPATVARAANAR